LDIAEAGNEIAQLQLLIAFRSIVIELLETLLEYYQRYMMMLTEEYGDTSNFMLQFKDRSTYIRSLAMLFRQSGPLLHTERTYSKIDRSYEKRLANLGFMLDKAVRRNHCLRHVSFVASTV
jgi:hypothetical protein